MKDEIKDLGGRPSEFDEIKVRKVLNEYLTGAVPENMKIPSVEGLALKLDIPKKTLYNWSKKNKWLLHALMKLKMQQKEYLVETGIFGGKEVNASIIALMLRANHNMVETTKTDITSKGEKINEIKFTRK